MIVVEPHRRRCESDLNILLPGDCPRLKRSDMKQDGFLDTLRRA
jgi:hypothetical protein